MENKQKENKNNVVTMRKWSVIIFVVISLILQLICISNSLWLGHSGAQIRIEKNEKNQFFVDLESKVQLNSVMTIAEFSQIYARNNLAKYIIFYIQNKEKIDVKKHWAAKEIAFIEKESGIEIKNADAVLTEDIAKIFDKNIKSYSFTSGEIRRSQIFNVQEINGFLFSMIICGIAQLLVVIFRKKYKIILWINLITLTLMGMHVIGTISKVSILLTTIMILLMLFRNEINLSAESNIFGLISPLILFLVSTLLFFMPIFFNNAITEGVCQAIPILVLWLTYTRAWKLMLLSR